MQLDGQTPRDGQLVDLGADGASFVTLRPIPPGSRGELQFELSGPEGARPVTLRVRTVYSSFEGDTTVARFRIGVSFVTPEPSIAALLDAFLADPR